MHMHAYTCTCACLNAFASAAVAGGNIFIYEGGEFVTHAADFSAGDTLQISVNRDGAIEYSREGAVIYVSEAVPSFPLFVDVAVHLAEAGIRNFE